MSRLRKKKLSTKKVGKKSLKAEQALESGSDVQSAVKKTKSLSSSVGQNVRKQEKYNKTNAASGELNFIQKGIQFFREVRIELKKVTWPTRKQTINSTVVIIIFVFIIAAFLGLVDFGLSKLVQIVLA